MTDTRGEEAPHGVAIDIDMPPPRWTRDYLSPAQQQLDVGLQWVSLLRQATNMTEAEAVTAYALFCSTIGKKDCKKAWPTIPELQSWTKIRSKATQIKALDGLEAKGWLLREVPDPASRRPAPKHARRKGYRLAWPLTDVLAADTGPATCGQPTKSGRPCTIRAGKGTDHPGTGPCHKHDHPQQAQTADQQDAAVVQQLNQPQERPPLRMVQQLNQTQTEKPGKNGHLQPPLLQPVVQPLNGNGSTVEPKYVKSPLAECARGVTGAWTCSPPEVEGTPSHDRPTEDDENITTAEQARRILERLSDVDRTWALHRARVNASRGHVSSPRSQPPADDAGATDRLLIDAARLAIRRRTA